MAPVAISMSNLPVVERVLVKQIDHDAPNDLDLALSEADPEMMDDEFWQALRTLDRTQLFESTVARLKELGRPLTIGELAVMLPPTHDSESLIYWLAMARQAGIEFDQSVEDIELHHEHDGWHSRVNASGPRNSKTSHF